ncbi:hypothetical protein DI458_35380 [Burkholderia contaminans]|nr:hypothetical protein [Burkholderia contaminans]ODN25450.1 hypothetical protein BGI28_19580 [Burkholderia contaminans]RBQ57702.1 hypothetical protein DI458_35380 [Burkholderia contaminans]
MEPETCSVLAIQMQGFADLHHCLPANQIRDGQHASIGLRKRRNAIEAAYTSLRVEVFDQRLI